MKKTVLVFGLIAGLIVTAMMVFSSVACYNNPDFEGSMLLGYAGMIIAFAFIFVGVKNLRDKHYGGAITFGKAFQAGLLITLIASTCYVLVWSIEYLFFMPDFMERYSEHVLRQARESGADAAGLAEQTAQMAKYKEWYKNPVLFLLLTYMEIFPVGLVIALLCALILKRKPKTPGAAVA